jgi:hypothetical protein
MQWLSPGVTELQLDHIRAVVVELILLITGGATLRSNADHRSTKLTLHVRALAH